MLLLDDESKNEIFTQLDIDPEHNFKILKPLGEGAYGAVFKAVDLRDNQLVALKVMRFDPEECRDLLSEIKILRSCNNDYIVNFKDTFHKDGNIWLAMEFCEGGSALDIVKVTKHTLSERQCQGVLFHALRGLEYLHSKDLIHRDIKAANLLINSNGRCKLADFGVAKSIRASGAGTTIGSPYWMAPEVLGTEKYDSSADIWSLGIVAIEMAIGKPPLSNYKPLQAMFMIPKNDPPTIPEDYIDDFSGGFIDFIAKCLNKNPVARPTATQLLRTDQWILKVSNGNTVEKELMPWIKKVMPLIEKDRDLKARMANQDESYDDSKWSDYTASLKQLSRDGSSNNYGTMVKNGGTMENNGGTLKIVPDDMEDHSNGDGSGGGSMVIRNSGGTISHNRTGTDSAYDVYDDNAGTIVRKASQESIMVDNTKDIEDDDDDDNFDGQTMITIQTKHESDDDDDEDEEDEDEYHENGFSPSSHTDKTHETANSALTTATNTTAATEQEKGRRTGGGYSIGNKSSFDGNTMVRQNSTDDEEEDPFQGQTMYRAPTVDSANGGLLSEEDGDDSVIITAGDDDHDDIMRLTINDNDTVTSMGTTKPAMSVSPKNAFIAPNAMMNVMNVNHVISDDEETGYENTRGYVNKPSSPLSGERKSQPPMATVQRLNEDRQNRPNTPSDTPQPNDELILGTAGPMGGYMSAETKGSKVVRSGRMSGGTHDVEDPTTPIPHYKGIQMVNTNGSRQLKVKMDADTDADVNVFDVHNLSQLAILANQLDFSKLVDNISFGEHIRIIIAVLTTWGFIVSYITLECSDRKRPREMQLFLFASASSILFNLVFNPFYFGAFANRYCASSIEELFAKTQPRFTSSVRLSVGDTMNNNHNDNDADSDDTINSNHNNDNNHKTFIFTFLVWILRFFAMVSALTLSYFIYLDLSMERYTDFTRYCIVALTLTLFVGNLPLMGHCLLYFRRVFLLYYFIGWVLVFGSEFAYFHFVRHVSSSYFHIFFLMNGVFLCFHLITTTWFSYMVKHRTLYLLDPLRFPHSNHYRISFAQSLIADGYTVAARAGSIGSIPYGRSVSCCCNKLICDSHTLLRFQSYASAISFWSFLGVLYTIGDDYVIFSACLFLLINTLWNPLFYSRRVMSITRKLRCCCPCHLEKWLYYMMLVIAYIFGFVLNIAWLTFSISAFILEDGATIQHSALINLCIFLFTTFVFFLPSIGYSFYRIPISYAVSNIFAALFCFFIPICISFHAHQHDTTVSPHTDGNTDYILQDWFYIYPQKTSLSSTLIGIIIGCVIGSLYLAFTGFSCVSYRLRKIFMERRKSYFRKEFAMNMIMFWSFVFSLLVLCANTVWVFGDNFGDDPYDSISIVSKCVYCVMCCVQSTSLLYAVFLVKYKFADNDRLKLYLSHTTDKIRRSCGCCCFFLFYPIIYVSYVVFIVTMSVCLGITKLFTIRQVRQLWLSFLIAHYDNIQKQSNENCSSNNESSNDSNTANVAQTVPVHPVHPGHPVATNSDIHNMSNIVQTNSPNDEDIQIEVMKSLGESTNFGAQYACDGDTNNELHQRVSSTALRSINMRIFRICNCCTPSWMSKLYINEAVYNNYLMSELVIEAAPLLILNCVNMYLLGDEQHRITISAYIQAATSGFFLFYTICKTLYYARFHEWDFAKFES